MDDERTIPHRPLTDTPANQPDERRKGIIRNEPGQPFEHYCPECGRWGAFRFGCDPTKGIVGIWYCGTHKSLDEKTGRLS
ncbi:hypothetical protein [Roseomonas mucosa]|uniref:hypothetical protein n=1 Tax=Roseomonas mucosa TaxID=207340 RepID=UPI0028CF1A0A|nr:hypothetical protein [Roseomonas mucosa]MDT8350957.1 hypothetical protein [Roseomonas mucosa]